MQPTTPTSFNDDISNFVRPNEGRYAADAKLYVEFYRKPVLHPGKSRDEGRAVYHEVDYVRVYVPGDKTSVVDKPVNDMDSQRFAERYNRWKAGQSDAVVGTPLSALPGMTPAKVEEYKFFKVVTVEQLAEANDNLGQKFMSFQQDKQRARNFIEVAKSNAPIEQMNAELQKRDAEIENLKSMVEALQATAIKSKRAAATEAA